MTNRHPTTAILVATALAAGSAPTADAAYTTVDGGRGDTVEFSGAGCGAVDAETTITNPPQSGAFDFGVFGPGVGSVLIDSSDQPVATVTQVDLVGAPPDVEVSVHGTGAACDPEREQSDWWTTQAEYGYFYSVRVLRDCGTVRG